MCAFKTGAARIALAYLANPGAPDLAIVPVGLHFTNKDRWRSEAAGLVGEPIDARAWLEANPVAGAAEMTAAMRTWIERLTVNFAGEEERDLVLGADRRFGYQGAPQPLDRATALILPKRWPGRIAWSGRAPAPRPGPRAVRRSVSRDPRLTRTLNALGVDPGEVGLPMHAGRVALFIVREVEVLIVGFVPAALGALVHLPPLVALRALVARL